MCFFCKEPGHRMAQCQKRIGQRVPTRQPQRYETPTVSNHRVNAYEEKEQDTETELFEHLTINAADFGGGTTEDDVSRIHQLLAKKDKVDGHAVKVLLDSGADHNVTRQGLAAEVVRRKKAVAERVDGTTTAPQWINEVKTDMQLEGYVLTNKLFSEWNLPATHDVILGKPWFSRFNPVINMRTHEVTLDFGLLNPE
ncbi:hypothetical protein PInf_026578 [Phytophthora infestans]|nr:hypothetical protein PInf_026578 [Phytophthora infestans]